MTRPGPTPLPDGSCRFVVWAPASRRVDVVIEARPDVPMEPADCGYHVATVPEVRPGTRYRFRLDGGDELPDPASRFQPDGVHGPSSVVDPTFAWNDQKWRGMPLSSAVIYELHVGTFTPPGTFDGVVSRLGDLAELGVTAIELMPVCQFPGTRNWGYDGVFPWSVQDSYGGPDDLKALVGAAHQHGLAVVLDVVHNHMGPEGNVLGRFGPYFTDRYRTPWGPAMNFDGPDSDEIRRFLVGSALRWFEEFHVDALRLDAIDWIVDVTAIPFIAELAEATHVLAEELGRPLHLIAESDLGDPRIIRPRPMGGLGLDAQWTDDFHHALHAMLTGERTGRYADFGGPEEVAKAYRQGYVLTGQYSVFRRRRHGAPTDGIPSGRFVVYDQTHDRVGNRLGGERLSNLVGFEQLKLAAGLVLLSPFVPLLFMGEEYGEEAPFQYFTSHTDPGLVEAVRGGRKRELAEAGWEGASPDPQDPATFERSRPHPDRTASGHHRQLRDLYRELLRLRPQVQAVTDPNRDPSRFEVRTIDPGLLWVRRTGEGGTVILALFNLGSAQAQVVLPSGGWEILVDSADLRWGGPGTVGPNDDSLSLPPWSFVTLRSGPEQPATA